MGKGSLIFIVALVM